MLCADTDLAPLIAALPQLHTDFGHLSATLDTTRHQLPTQDIHFPSGGEEAMEGYDEALQRELAESEKLLSEISDLTGGRTVPINQFVASLSAIDRNVGATVEGLASCHTDLDTIQDLTTRLLSLYVQKSQT